MILGIQGNQALNACAYLYVFLNILYAFYAYVFVCLFLYAIELS